MQTASDLNALSRTINFGARTLVDGVTRVDNHFPEPVGRTR